MTTLWRAAPVASAHFGRGSYWTASPQFAQRFRAWLDETYEIEHRVYQAEVDLQPIESVPFGVQVRSTAVTQEVIASLAAKGYRWLSFFDGAFGGVITQEFVYLGTEPIQATPA